MKNFVYQTKVDTRDELIQRIHDAANAIRNNLEEINVWQAVEKRAQLCIVKQGGHIENYL